MELKSLSANWKKLQAQLQKEKPSSTLQQSKEKAGSRSLKRKRSIPARSPPPSKRTSNGESSSMEDDNTVESQQISSEDAKSIIDSIVRRSQDASNTTRPLTATNRENEGLAIE